MKKFKSISLIETLISLAIVGLSITALLPVMTIKKEATAIDKGNSFWKCYGTKDSTYDYYNCSDSNVSNISRISQADPTKPVSIGAPATAGTKGLWVDATGFKNSDVLPLITNYLQYSGQTVTPYDNSILLSANPNTTTGNQCGAVTNAPQTNLYVGDDGVIIENNTTATKEVTNASGSRTTNVVAFCKNNDGNRYYNTQPITNNLYVIKNNNIEYINVTSGTNQIGIGENALKPFNDSSNNVISIAKNTNFNSSTATYNNALFIGNVNTDASSFAPDTGYVIAKNGTGSPFHIHSNISVGLNGTGTITASAFIIPSDKNLKDIVGKYTKGIDEILKIKPVNYTYKSDETNAEHVGVIAQDLKKVFPESVSVNKETGYLAVNTDGIFYALLNSIKTLNKKNEELAKQNEELENKIAQLRTIRDRIRAEKGGHDE